MLLLDDPLRNVDAKLRYEMRLELPRLLKKFNATVLYVTQDYKEAMALGERVGVLHRGRFEQVARPAAIYRDPSMSRSPGCSATRRSTSIPCRPRCGHGAEIELFGQTCRPAGGPGARRRPGPACSACGPSTSQVHAEREPGAFPWSSTL